MSIQNFYWWGEKCGEIQSVDRFSTEMRGGDRQSRLAAVFINNIGQDRYWTHFTHTVTHADRKRIELEDKAKVVTSDWGTESLPR